jgi:hypothetical protein
MQYLLVKFKETRQVVVDDHFNGTTNTVIEIDDGSHDISLAAPYDYSPHLCKVNLSNTNPFEAFEVEFT